MNSFLSDDWIEKIDRLALGLEPIDAQRGTRVAHPLKVVFDEEARGVSRPHVERHNSCLHALLYQPGVAGRVKLRFFDDDRPFFIQRASRRPIIPRSMGRRFVPRLISYPILTVPQAEVLSYHHRVRRPVMFPGAAYDVASKVTGLRGRVKRAGEPERWVRVVATIPGTQSVVGRAHGDDRGEFLLLISSLASPVAFLADPFDIRVEVSARAALAPPNPADLPSLDPLWDLPEEIAPLLSASDPADDPVSAGIAPPPSYTATVGRNVALEHGTLQSDPNPFIIP